MTDTGSTTAGAATSDAKGSESGPEETSAFPRELRPGQALRIPLVFAGALAALAFVPPISTNSHLPRTFLGAAAVLLVWTGVLYWKARREGRTLTLDVGIYKHHWVQALTQLTILFYWGWHVDFVYAWLPLIFGQFPFAWGVESLLNWSRRDRYSLGFGPAPIILSINLFLWFRPEWFYWQFVLILLGYLAKEFIRWQRGGRSRHIFNPSSFPLSIASLALIVTGATDVTLASAIAQTQYNPPNMYLVIFLASIPVQILFGVARVTIAAVITIFSISYGYFAVTGTYLFFDAWVTVPVFLGMHLIITDPSTSPRSEAGQFIFGILYALGVVAVYAILAWIGAPRFYDKLIPVVFLNLTVRQIESWVASKPAILPDFSKLEEMMTTRQRFAGYTGVWACIFVFLSAVGGVGDDHRGQYFPFWRDTCREGNARACSYAVFMLANYCEKGSGWACNESGIQDVRRGRAASAARAFERGCELGFPPACENADLSAPSAGGLSRGPPEIEDLPVVLRGSESPIEERDPERLVAMACEQGWPSMCERQAAGPEGSDGG